MVKRLENYQVLQRLQDIESHGSDGKLSDNENPLGNNVYPSVVERDEEGIVNDSSKEDIDHDAVTDLDENNDVMQNKVQNEVALHGRSYSRKGACNNKTL